MIFSALNMPIGKVQIFLDAKNNGALPLDPVCFQHLKVIVVTQLQLMNN